MLSPSFARRAAKLHPLFILTASATAAWFGADLWPHAGAAAAPFVPGQTKRDRSGKETPSTPVDQHVANVLPEQMPQTLFPATPVTPAASPSSITYAPFGGGSGPSGGDGGGGSSDGGSSQPKQNPQGSRPAVRPHLSEEPERSRVSSMTRTMPPRPRIVQAAPPAPRVVYPAPPVFNRPSYPFGGFFAPRGGSYGGGFHGGGGHVGGRR